MSVMKIIHTILQRSSITHTILFFINSTVTYNQCTIIVTFIYIYTLIRST